MRADSDVAALARALFAVSERAGAHRVNVVSGARCAELRVRDGFLVALSGVDVEPLGDTLLRYGALDVARHARALSGGQRPGEPVGAWLVRVGAADEASVEHALRLQSLGRVAGLLRWTRPRYVLQSQVGDGAAADAPERVDGAVALVAATWWGLLHCLEHAPGSVRPFAATALSDFGLRLQQRLWRARVETSEWACALSGGEEAGIVRAALDAVGGTRSARAPLGDAHGLLLRKRRQLRRREPAHILLDISSDASPVEVKKAFRRLVRQLHPDRFGSQNPGITRCCTEVTYGLAQAMRALSPIVPVAGCGVP